jgi:hypothetical protein
MQQLHTVQRCQSVDWDSPRTFPFATSRKARVGLPTTPVHAGIADSLRALDGQLGQQESLDDEQDQLRKATVTLV